MAKAPYDVKTRRQTLPYWVVLSTLVLTLSGIIRIRQKAYRSGTSLPVPEKEKRFIFQFNRALRGVV
jgi:hypothetical protein